MIIITTHACLQPQGDSVIDPFSRIITHWCRYHVSQEQEQSEPKEITKKQLMMYGKIEGLMDCVDYINNTYQ